MNEYLFWCETLEEAKKKAMNALTDKYKEHHEEPQEMARMSSLQMLGAIKPKIETRKAKTKGLMNVDVKMNGVAIEAVQENLGS